MPSRRAQRQLYLYLSCRKEFWGAIRTFCKMPNIFVPEIKRLKHVTNAGALYPSGAWTQTQIYLHYNVNQVCIRTCVGPCHISEGQSSTSHCWRQKLLSGQATCVCIATKLNRNVFTSEKVSPTIFYYHSQVRLSVIRGIRMNPLEAVCPRGIVPPHPEQKMEENLRCMQMCRSCMSTLSGF
jgi:hypothetical protein